MATALKNYQLYIGGEWVDATSDDGLEVINPATEETIGSVPQGSIADVDRAVGAARKAYADGTWRRMAPRQRSDALLRFMQVIADRKAELVDLIIAEAGAARWVADGLQFDTGFKYAQWFAERTASFPFQDPLPPPRSLNPDISPGVEQVILRALAKDRNLRYPTAAALTMNLYGSSTAVLSE